MNEPTMLESRNVAPDITSLVSYIPIPGYGVLPVNAFVIHAEQLVLVDTGLASLRSEFLQELRSVVDPKDLRWIWITHADMDHLGNLEAVLSEATNARIVTTYIGMAKMGLHGLPLDRVFLLNQGQSLNVGDRQLMAVKPPTFDAPETAGLLDKKSNTLISADCFGAIIDRPAETAADIEQNTLRDGSVLWATIDAPWLSTIDAEKFDRSLAAIEQLNAEVVLSSHLPAAEGMTKTFADRHG